MGILLRQIVMALVLAFGVVPCWGQLPSSFLLGKPPASLPAASPQEDTAADLNKELAESQLRLRDAQDSMARLQAQLSQSSITDTSRNILLKQFNFRQTLADRYAQQVGYLKQLQVLEQRILDAKQQRNNWLPPAGSPPWPITDGDQVRNEMLVGELRIKQLSRESASLSESIIALSREKAEADVLLRQIQEKVGNADSAKVTDADRQQLENARAGLAFKSAMLLRTDLERRVKDAERTLQEVQLETVSKTWNYYAGRFSLSPEVLASAKADLQSLIDRDRALELKALARSEAAMARLVKAQSSYQELDEAKTSATRLAQARASLDIAQAEEVAARSEIDRLRQLIEIGGYGLQVWDARAEIYGKPRPDAARMDEIAQRVRLGVVRIRQARDFLQQSLTTKEQEAFDLREVGLISGNSLDRKVIAARLQAANAQSDAARSVLAALDKFDQFLVIVQSELGIKEQEQTFIERLAGYWDRAVYVIRAIWSYELFTVDDSVVADGKEVKTTRSVTIGKSIGVIGILVLGFIMVSWLIRALIGLAERRMGMKSSVATLVRRWLTIVATATLIVMSFNLVQIPLSVFAFLGGALAIGVGFGTQNLLKNLISGVMLLIERPIRIGDLVEIDGVRGRVTSIGIRFSTIHSSDGIDTLIPNSELVEKKLTNWTFSNPDVRREIRVGVAYGSDPVKVKNLMRVAALEHPDVMPNPEPMVVLDDLGESALIFTLRYWIRIETGTDGRRVDSDLRCEILEKLTLAGIEVPYPQRDIHLSAAQPLQIMIERGSF